MVNDPYHWKQLTRIEETKLQLWNIHLQQGMSYGYI